MTITEVHYQAIGQDPKSNGRVKGSLNYIVQKRMDGDSEALETAISTGKVFQSATMKLVQGNTTVSYKLTNVVLTSYSAYFVQGKPATEEFVVQFQSKTTAK